MPISRRRFVHAAAGTILAGPLLLTTRTRGAARPSNQLGLGLIGMGIQNRHHLGQFLGNDAVRVLAVCDVDTTRRNHAKGLVDAKYDNHDCGAFVDYHELLARRDIDAVVISTPDHWHAIQVIDACKAGKDIYCEKPLALTLAEGKAMTDAVRTHGRVFQTGSQQRTEWGGRFRTACEHVRSGRIGKVQFVHVGVGVSSVWCDLPEEPLEPGLEWDRWLGPAPVRPYNSILSPRGVNTHYPNWRLYREYSGGMMTDWGAHHLDIAQWGLDMDASGPVRVLPPREEKAERGARLLYASGVEVVHGGPGGVTFIGEKGVIAVDRDRTNCIPDSVMKEPLGEGDVRLPAPTGHHADWLEAIKTRAKPICDVEVGARSIACAQLLNLAYWHRRAFDWDPAAWRFRNEADNALLDYERREGYGLPG